MLSAAQSIFEFPGPRKGIEVFGFKITAGGAHISRTIMLDEVRRVLEVASAEASVDDCRRVVVNDNVLNKATETTRQKTFRHLRELYALSGDVAIFTIYRDLACFDSQSVALLSVLITWARDPLLRATTPAILEATVGDQVTSDYLQQALSDAYPHHYSQNNIAKVSRNAASSWTQSGHLTGRTQKTRCSWTVIVGGWELFRSPNPNVEALPRPSWT